MVAPSSRGTVRLASAAPDAAPRVDPGFLTDPRDQTRLETGLAIIREAAAGPALGRLLQAEVWPGPDVTTRAGLRAYIRRTVGSYYHPAGTCRMGTGDLVVVDPRLRAPPGGAEGGRRVGHAGHPQRPAERDRAGHRRARRGPDHRGLNP